MNMQEKIRKGKRALKGLLVITVGLASYYLVFVLSYCVQWWVWEPIKKGTVWIVIHHIIGHGFMLITFAYYLGGTLSRREENGDGRRDERFERGHMERESIGPNASLEEYDEKDIRE